jgi:hypothetical protein
MECRNTKALRKAGVFINNTRHLYTWCLGYAPVQPVALHASVTDQVGCVCVWGGGGGRRTRLHVAQGLLVRDEPDEAAGRTFPMSRIVIAK